MPPRVSHLLETALYVADLQRSKTFYQRVFAFPVLFEDERMIGMELPGPAILLLFRRGGSTEPSTVPGGVIPSHDASGIQHLCFAIPLASLVGWERHLVTQDLEIESVVIQAHGGTSVYFRDPDRHLLEVATPGLWDNY